MKETWWFVTGQSQWMPKWMEKLPRWMHPIYQGNNTFKWLGKVIKAYSRPGETLMMCWRRIILTRIYCLVWLAYIKTAQMNRFESWRLSSDFARHAELTVLTWMAQKRHRWHL